MKEIKKRYGMMEVISEPISKPREIGSRQLFVFVRCDVCGEISEKKLTNLRRKNTKACSRSCGGTTHGMSGTRIYKIWDDLISRTSRPSHGSYKHYKDRKPPEKWYKFEGFYEDVGCDYIDGYSIDRIDNDKPYSKDNCRWITVEENISLAHKGRVQSEEHVAKRVASHKIAIAKRNKND